MAPSVSTVFDLPSRSLSDLGETWSHLTLCIVALQPVFHMKEIQNASAVETTAVIQRKGRKALSCDPAYYDSASQPRARATAFCQPP